MLDWLRPGGWLLLEEFHVDEGLIAAAASELRPFLVAMTRVPSIDMDCARHLAEELTALGAVEVHAEGTVDTVIGGSVAALLYALTVRALSPLLVAAGLLSEADIADLVRQPRAPGGVVSSGAGWRACWCRASSPPA
jgi:hypothetical protein